MVNGRSKFAYELRRSFLGHQWTPPHIIIDHRKDKLDAQDRPCDPMGNAMGNHNAMVGKDPIWAPTRKPAR